MVCSLHWAGLSRPFFYPTRVLDLSGIATVDRSAPMEIVMKLHFRTEYETDVYVSDGGYIVIRQDNYPQDDLRVSLSPNQAKVLFANLDDLLVDAEYLFELNGDEE